LTHNNAPGQKNLAEALQQIWQKTFGIPVALEGCEWNIFFTRLNEGQFQLGGCLNSALYSDPLYQLEIFNDKNHFANASSWENDVYKQLLALSIASEGKERQKHLKKAEKLLLEEMPVIPIFSSTYKYMTNDRLHGLFINKPGDVDFKTAYFK
jgi:ABC-type oligopeptide transport system substrate-binding subunit